MIIFVSVFNEFPLRNLASIVGLVFMLMAFLIRTGVQKQCFNSKRIARFAITNYQREREALIY